MPKPSQKKVFVFRVFSGTGNTLLAARKMAEVMESAGAAVEFHRMPEEPWSEPPPGASAVFAFPVYEQTVPWFVREYIAGIPKLERPAKAYILTTLAGFSGFVKSPLGRLLEKRGFEFAGIREVVMPSNFILHTSDDKTPAITRRGLRDAADFAEKILEEKTTPPRISALNNLASAPARLCAAVFNKTFSKLRARPEKCVGCGLCAKLCPTKNIEMRDGKPVWDGKCGLCLRCVSFCPKDAVKARFADKLFRPRYTAEGVAPDDLL